MSEWYGAGDAGDAGGVLLRAPYIDVPKVESPYVSPASPAKYQKPLILLDFWCGRSKKSSPAHRQRITGKYGPLSHE